MSETIQIAPVVPDEECVSGCRELLARAESGELRGLAYIGLTTGKQVAWGFVGAEAKRGYMRMYGLLHWLAYQAMRRWDELSEEV